MSNTNSRWIANANLPVPSPEPILVHVGGAGDAMRATLPRYAEFNRTSQRRQFAFVVSDPAPGKAIALAREADRLGITLRPHERTMQEAVRANPGGREPELLHIDDAAAMGEVMDLVEPTEHPLLGAAVFVGPTNKISALFFVVDPHNKELFSGVRALIGVMAKFQAYGGSRAVFGDEARAEHRILRPALRTWMANQVNETLPRMVAGLRVETPISVTSDGLNTMPLFVHQGASFSEPHTLADAVSQNPDWRMRLGAPVTIAEVAGDGLRFHRVRRRVLDRKLSVDTSTVLSEEERRRADEERREAAKALEAALTKAERETVNQQAPLLLTD